MERRLWNREELMLTINLYCKTSFGRLYKSNPDVVELSRIINRTPSALAWKLVNFASLDPSLKARGIKGASNASKLDKAIWEEFFDNWDDLSFQSEMLLAKKKTKMNIDEIYPDIKNKRGEEKIRLIKTRVNQSFFRSSLIASYNNTCCITGLKTADFLIAGHIIPWAKDIKNRLNPQNGLLLNSLHDKAFEHGFITISDDYKVLICSDLLKSKNKSDIDFFASYHNKEIILPSRFLPNKEFLKIHNNEKFRG